MKPTTPSPTPALLDRCDEIAQQEAALREGGGAAGQERQHKLERLFVRERIAALIESAFATSKLQSTLAA